MDKRGKQLIFENIYTYDFLYQACQINLRKHAVFFTWTVGTCKQTISSTQNIINIILSWKKIHENYEKLIRIVEFDITFDLGDIFSKYSTDISSFQTWVLLERMAWLIPETFSHRLHDTSMRKFPVSIRNNAVKYSTDIPKNIFV